MTPDALELAVRYYNLQLELKERITLLEEIIHQFCLDAEEHHYLTDLMERFSLTKEKPE